VVPQSIIRLYYQQFAGFMVYNTRLLGWSQSLAGFSSAEIAYLSRPLHLPPMNTRAQAGRRSGREWSDPYAIRESIAKREHCALFAASTSLLPNSAV
jgi:hypothetical protein